MAIYHIVLLPEKTQRKLLNTVKNNLYTGGYRSSLKPSSSDVHVTLTQVVFGVPGMMSTLENSLLSLSQRYKRFSCSYSEVTDKIQNGQGRVSLLFENKNNEIGLLTQELITLTSGLGIDDVTSYIEKIKTVKPKHKRTDNVLDYTANHMNICNYALPEKTAEAKSIVEKSVPKEIIFDTIALRNQDGQYEFEIMLSE